MNFRTLSACLCFCFIVVATTSSYAQSKRASFWPFSTYELNFSGNSVSFSQKASAHLERGMGAMCDENGALQLYTDGYTAFDKTYQAMPNGANLIPSGQSPIAQRVYYCTQAG
ncbi:MAG: hypothetical protein QM734_14150 [Cyclobacteriaceae bacterium]